jgi:hypothetical protein
MRRQMRSMAFSTKPGRHDPHHHQICCGIAILEAYKRKIIPPGRKYMELGKSITVGDAVTLPDA